MKMTCKKAVVSFETFENLYEGIEFLFDVFKDTKAEIMFLEDAKNIFTSSEFNTCNLGSNSTATSISSLSLRIVFTL